MWILLASRQGDPPGSFFDRRQIDGGEIRIGRSERHCEWVLRDDQGFISREHCIIAASGLDLFVTDTSKNGVALNDPDRRIVPGQPVSIRMGDRLLMNDIVITIASPSQAASIGMSPQDTAPPSVSGNAPQDEFWSMQRMDPFLEDFGSDDSHDFLKPPGFAAASHEGFPLSPELPPDHSFGEPAGIAYEPLRMLAQDTSLSSSIVIPEDWDNPGNGTGDGLPVPEFTPIDSTSASQLLPPGPGGENHGTPDGFDMASQEPASTCPPASQLAGSADWAAFYEGAGLTPEELTLPPDAMYRLGALYRQTVLGMCDILQDRATFKDEFRVERTQLGTGRNNPLKYLSAYDAAKVMIGHALPGFMDGEEAMHTSFEDIKKHQLAMLSGVQNALATVFARLSPVEMEKLVSIAEGGKKGFLSKRGADRWSTYVTVYESLRKDATSNATGIMSSAFREGYEKFMRTKG